MAEVRVRKPETPPSGLSREDEVLAYAAILVLLGAIAFTIAAIFV